MLARIRAALVLVGVAASALLAASPASADWGGRDPRLNIAPTPAIVGSVCDSNPHSDACRYRLIDALVNARHHLGLSGYSLPDRFLSLSPQEKLLVLANQDRRAENLKPLYGMNAKLNHNAQAAVSRRDDPSPVDYLADAHWTLWAANWAGGNGATENPLTAHYDWMYYDGLNANGSSWNLLCRAANRAYCWKHRHNILVKPGSGRQLAIGIGGGPDGHGLYGWTQLIEAFPASAPVAYVPTVVRMTHHWAPHAGGRVITLGGFGFVHVTKVTVTGKSARVLSRDPWHLTVKVPRNAPKAKGYIVVHTTGGASSKNYAAEFHYGG